MRVKTRIVQKVFVFLLLTVGILYIALWLHRRVREPFLNPAAEKQKQDCEDAKRNCKEQIINNNKVWLCEDNLNDLDAQTRAQKILWACANSPDITHSADSDLGTPLIGNSDTSCYSVLNSMTGSNFFVCYQRPPAKYYDPMSGQDEYYMPQTDPVPEELSNELPAVCGAYTSVVSAVVRNFSTTKAEYNKMNEIVNTMSNAYIAMSNLSTTKCNSTRPRGTDLLNSCRELGTFLSNYTFSSANSNVGRLLTIQTAYSNATSNLISTFNNHIQPQFNGFGCAFPNIPKPAEFN
jgi:hypothetical protein